MHVECDAHDFLVIEPELEEIHSSSGMGKYSLGVKLCLLPEMSTATNFTTRTKIEWLRNCQACFDRYIVHIVIWEIADLDKPFRSDGLTLQNMIMSL